MNDDIHGSTATLESDCAPRIAEYFLTGRPDNGVCQGVPVPDDEIEQPTSARQAGLRPDPDYFDLFRQAFQ